MVDTTDAPIPAEGIASALTPKGRQTRRRVMDAATALYAERGYAAVRMSDIAERAGLSTGALYRYFPDRHSLTIQLLRDLTDEVFEFVHNPRNTAGPVLAATEITRRYFTFYEEHRALLGVLVELSQTDAEVAEIWARSRRAFYSRISQSLSRGREGGHVRADLSLDVAAEMLGSMTEFYAFQRFVLGGDAITPTDLETASRTIAEIWICGVSTPAAGE